MFRLKPERVKKAIENFVLGFATSRSVIMKAVEDRLGPEIERLKPPDVVKAIRMNIDLLSLPETSKFVKDLEMVKRTVNIPEDELNEILGWFDLRWLLSLIYRRNQVVFSTIINYPDGRGIEWLELQRKKIISAVRKYLTS